MKRIFGREKPHSIITPFPIEIDPEPLSALEDNSYFLHASERAEIARKVLRLDPNGALYDEKQREITSSAVLGILNALDSLGNLDLRADREKSSHRSGHGRQGNKSVYYSAIGFENGNGKEKVAVRSKGKDDKNFLAGITGTKEYMTRNSYSAANSEKPGPVLESMPETQLRTRQLEQQHSSNAEYQELPIKFPQQPASSSDKRGVSPEDIMRHLFQEYRVGKDNTQLLSDALTNATPEQLEIEVTRAFYKKCQASQALVYAQIPWASAVADRSRLVRDFRHKDKTVFETTPQETLLAALLQANEALYEALRMYDDLELVTVGNGAEGTGSKQCQNGLDTKECRPLSPVMEVAESLSRIPTPPPSYEAPLGTAPVIRSLSLPPEDPTDKVATPTNYPISSSDPSNKYERLTPPHSSRFQMQVSPVVVGEQHEHSPPSQVSDLSETTRSTSLSRPTSSCSQSSLPPQGTGSAQAEIGTIPTTHEDDTLPKPLNTSMAHITETSQIHQESISPTVREELSPTHREIMVSVPDLTGRITRDGDYPAARGGFADVYKCVLRSQPDECVAVKVLHTHIHDSNLEGKFAKRIRREILVWQRLNHENVLPLLGTVSHFGRFMSMVSPWMDNGSLMQYLQECADDMSLARRLQLACEVASGLTYLHSSRVVHGDLTGTNVMITDEGKACLCDFGLSSLALEFHDTTFCTSTMGGNARWAAPEIYRITVDDVVQSATPQSDVYSLGCIMLEILSGKVPYYYLPREGQVLLELQNGNKPRRPQEGHMNDVLWDKINECWEDNPNERPTSDNVARFLMRQFKLETSVRSH